MRRRALLLWAAFAASACAPEAGRLVLEAPARLRQAAVSDDGELCGRLAVDLTFDNASDGEDPLLLEEPLLASDDEACTFELQTDASRTFPRGTYDALVRFLAADDAYVGSDSCAGDGVEELWVGAYVIEGLAFPDDVLRIEEDAFLSYPGDEGGLPVPGVSFDVDGDERDNLAEVGASSDPCVENRPPEISVTADAGAVDEGQPVRLTVTSADPADVRHRVTVRISHRNGPESGTEVVTFRRFTSAPAEEEIDPDKAVAGITEPWDLTVDAVTENGNGDLEVELLFVPDEPFVGAIRVEAVADDGFGNVLAETNDVIVDVTDVTDPTELLIENEDGALVPVTRVDFAEVDPADPLPTENRFQLQNEGLDADVSQWTVELVDGPADLTLEQDLSFWRLTWAPDNDTVLAEPADGYTFALQFKDADGNPDGPPESYALGITPLFNNPPSLGDLSGLDLSLASGSFSEKRLAFTFHDPDEASGQPTCTATLAPVAPTTCTTAWDEVRCEVSGPRAGGTWPFTLTLVPGGSYFDDCGDDPSFSLSLSIADVAPVGADPATPQVAATSDGCAGDSCVETLVLYTAEVVAVQEVTGGAAAPAAPVRYEELIVNGVDETGVLIVHDDGPETQYDEEKAFVVDLATSPPSFVHGYPRTTVCNFEEGEGDRVPHGVVVDEVNGRFVGWGRASATDDSECSTTEEVVFSFDSAPPFAATTWPLDEVCAGACSYYHCAGRPVGDSLGNVYFPCGGDTGTLARIDASGQVTQRDFAALDAVQGPRGVALVTAPSGGEWLVWPDNLGLLAIDVTTWDDGAVVSERVSPSATWNDFWIEAGAADPYRGAYWLAYDPPADPGSSFSPDTLDVELYRVRFETTGAEVDGPLNIGEISSHSNGDLYTRLLFKPPLGQPAGEPDLVVTGNTVAEVRPHVDVDSFSLVAPRAAEDYYYTYEVYESADPRFYVGWVTSTTAGFDGLKLFPWDPTQPYSTQSVPGTTDWRQDYQKHWRTWPSARLATMSDESSPPVLRVLRFTQAP